MTERVTRHFEDEKNLQLDFEQFLATLSAEERDLCARLKTHSAAEIADELNVPRTTMQHRIARLRALFVAGGFDKV